MTGRLCDESVERVERLNPRLEETDRIMEIGRNMNAADIIHEIETLPEDEKGKVIDFVQRLAERKFEEEQIRIAVQRLEDYDKGLEEGVPYEEARRLIEQED